MTRGQMAELSEPSADLDIDQEAMEAAAEAAVDGDSNAGVGEPGEWLGKSFAGAEDEHLWHLQLGNHNTNARFAAHCEQHSIAS